MRRRSARRRDDVDRRDEQVTEASDESFPASDPPAGGIPDRPPANAEQKWKAARKQKLRTISRRRASV
jgi:hypothetical protein